MIGVPYFLLLPFNNAVAPDWAGMEFSRCEESSDWSADRFFFLFSIFAGFLGLGWVRIRWFAMMVRTFF